jgi:hypothetical protein
MKNIIVLILTCLISSSVFAEAKGDCIHMRVRAAYYWGVAIQYDACLNGVSVGMTTKNVPAYTNVIISVLKDSKITFKEYYPAGVDHRYKVSGSMPALEFYGVDCGGATGWQMGVDNPSCYLFYPFSPEWKTWQKQTCQRANSGDFQCH